jgi:ribose transport system permease protein
MELEVIAAVILGGSALTGGKGHLFGTLLGVLILGALSNGMGLLGWSSDLQDVARGVVLMGAVSLDQLRRKARL